MLPSSYVTYGYVHPNGGVTCKFESSFSAGTVIAWGLLDVMAVQQIESNDRFVGYAGSRTLHGVDRLEATAGPDPNATHRR
jgi:hypothetical protein